MSIYFDNAATSSPKPKCVLDAVQTALTRLNANPGRSGHRTAIEAGKAVLKARGRVAALLGASDVSSVVFALNCTDALNLAIKGSLHYGDHVITSLLEHNSVLRPLNELARRGRISLTMLPPHPDGFIDPNDVAGAIRNNTRLIALTHASNVTGAIQPVALIGSIARKHGIRYLIDGAQALGALPVNVDALQCDLYAFPGHKGLLGPQGTGGLFIRPGTELFTLREGGTGSSSDSMLQPSEMPERYESGTLNLPGIAGLGAGCEYVASQLSQIMSHERELTAAIHEGLSRIHGAVLYSPSEESGRTGIVTFNLGDLTSSQTADILSAHGIAVRGGLHCAPGAHRILGTSRRGAVRVSVGYKNTFDDVSHFLDVIRKISVQA